MRTRKLFYAVIDKRKVHIEHAEQGKKYSCPFCEQEVIPKQGDEKIWHYAHMEKSCFAMQAESEGKVQPITSFTDSFSSEIPFYKDARFYRCRKCKQKGQTDHAVKLAEEVLICKPCYSELDSQSLLELI